MFIFYFILLENFKRDKNIALHMQISILYKIISKKNIYIVAKKVTSENEI